MFAVGPPKELTATQMRHVVEQRLRLRVDRWLALPTIWVDRLAIGLLLPNAFMLWGSENSTHQRRIFHNELDVVAALPGIAAQMPGDVETHAAGGGEAGS